MLAEKDSKIFNLENELKWIKEQVRIGQERAFGRSTEKFDALQVTLILNEEDITQKRTKYNLVYN